MKAWAAVEAQVGARQALDAGECTAMLQGGVLEQQFAAGDALC